MAFDGSFRRESISAAEARREMSRVAFDDLFNRHIVWCRTDMKRVAMGTIVRAYCRSVL